MTFGFAIRLIFSDRSTNNDMLRNLKVHSWLKNISLKSTVIDALFGRNRIPRQRDS